MTPDYELMACYVVSRPRRVPLPPHSKPAEYPREYLCIDTRPLEPVVSWSVFIVNAHRDYTPGSIASDLLRLNVGHEDLLEARVERWDITATPVEGMLHVMSELVTERTRKANAAYKARQET